MNTCKKSAILVGVLFIIATAFLFIGQAVYEPILGSPEYLDLAYPNRTTVIIGILLEFACVLAIPLIAVVLFPVLRKHSEALAIGYVGFRFFEAVLFVDVQINKLSLIDTSRDYLSRGGADAPLFQSIGSAIQSVNDRAFAIYVVIFTVGALILYSALYRSRLVPRWISAWGFLAAVLLLIGSVLIMLDVFAGASGVELVFSMPIAVNEMVLAVWLIVKGFNSAAIKVES
jgi:hypothetical protein